MHCKCPLTNYSAHRSAGGLGAQSSIAILAVQVREQEHQWKRKRPNNRSNPRPDFEGASSTVSKSAGKIDRADHQQCQGYVMLITLAPMLLCANHSMELGAPVTGRQDPLKFLGHYHYVRFWHKADIGLCTAHVCF